jgi:hypothetical protein
MYTLMAIGGGLAVLVVLLLLTRLIWGATAVAKAALVFIPIWAVIAAIYVGLGVTQYGYSVTQELPMFVLDFGVPAVVALLVWRWLRPAPVSA